MAVAGHGAETEETGKKSVNLMDNNFLSVQQHQQNAHTYIYEPDTSLSKLTLQILPTEDNYKKQQRLEKTREKFLMVQPKWPGPPPAIRLSCS